MPVKRLPVRVRTSAGVALWLVSAMVAATEADETLFRLLDTSGNGYLSGTEATEVIQYDTDGDKRVTREEFMAGRTGKNAGAGPPAQQSSAAPVTAPATDGTKYKAGDTVEAHDRTKWYKAQVLKVENGKYYIHYDGWSSTWDEWLTEDRIRPVGSSREAPARAAGSASGATAAKTPAAKNPAAPAAPAQPVPGDHGLEGLYLQVKTSYGMNGSLSFNQEHYYFSRNGRVLRGVPEGGLDDFDFDQGCAGKPRNCGYYGISGSEITMSWPGRQEKMKFERADEGLEIDGIFAHKVGEMTPGQKLEGRYSKGATSSYQGSFVSSAQSITFHPDGTFESGSIGGVSFGSGAAGGSASSTSSSRGTYRVGRNTLELKHSDGKVTKHTIYPYDMGKGRVDLSIDGGMMKREQ